MALSFNPDLSDVVQAYTATRLTISTSATEAKVGVTRNPSRQLAVLYNDGTDTIYYGPTGVTASGGFGLPLAPGQAISLALGDVGIYCIVAAGTQPLIIQEFA